MIALDTNILVDLLVSSQPQHKSVVRGLKSLNDHLATTPINIGEVLRLLTHPRVFPKPMLLEAAVQLLKAFLTAHRMVVLQPEEQWWTQLEDLTREDLPDLRGNEVFDAQIALCLRHNGVRRLWTRDSDFRKYRFIEIIRWQDPVES